MDRTLQDFEDATIARNLVARVVEATEFPTEEALKKYLQSHPKADKSKHTVRKNKTPTQFRRTDKTRWDDVLKNTKDLKALGEKATKGDEDAKAEVSKRYTALVDHGESMADDAKPLLTKLKGNSKLSEDAKDLLGKLEKAVKKWDSISHAAQKAKGRNTEAQLQHANDVMSAASDIRTLTHWLTNEAVKNKALKRAADEWKVEATSEVTAKYQIDTTKFYRMFEDIERRIPGMASALGKYTRDPGRMLPQLDNLLEDARQIETDIRIIQRLVDALKSGKTI
jgi:hypothetical protein